MSNSNNPDEYIDHTPGGPGQLPGKGNPYVQIQYLQGQLDTARDLLHNKQERINELEEAVKQTSFQSADKLPLKSPPSLESCRIDIENIMVNKTYVVLDLNL